MNDAINATGVFHLKIFDAAGRLIEEYEHKNLIVTGGKTCMAQLLGGTAVNKHITQIGFGTDGSDPAVGNTALTNSFIKNVASVSYPDAVSVQYSWTLETSEANGKAIREFGLLAADNTLVARRTRDVINKTSDLRLEGTWKLIF